MLNVKHRTLKFTRRKNFESNLLFLKFGIDFLSNLGKVSPVIEKQIAVLIIKQYFFSTIVVGCALNYLISKSLEDKLAFSC